MAVAKKGKSGHSPAAKAAAVHTASMLPLPEHAKSSHKDKGKTHVASREGKGKGKVQAGEKTGSKKSGVKLARKNDAGARSSKVGKSSAPAKRSKDKQKVYKASMLISEAR
jgi:hypothetical protein